MPDYNIAFETSALTTKPHDVFAVLASSESKVEVHKISVGIRSTDISNLQGLGIDIYRGSTSTPGSTATVTPANLDGHSGRTTAAMTVNSNSSSLMSTTSAERLWSDTLGDSGFCYEPGFATPIIDVSQRLHVRVTAPSAAVTLHVAATLVEIGKDRV